MKILVIGSGGREHAICRQFAQNPRNEVFCAPGNAGISQIARCVNIDLSDFEALCGFVSENEIDFAFVGPEVPLAAGIVDFFESRGLKAIGPSKAAAKLEASKIYSKEFMKKYGVPTADFRKFYDMNSALNFLETWEENKKVVVKADGLAAGKGVYMCDGRADAANAVKEMMVNNSMGAAGASVVIEEFIDGPELSYLIFTDGVSYSMMPAAQDHKRVNDNDEGLNTGGMGAYAPAPLATSELTKKVEDTIVKKVIAAIRAEGFDYKGVLYIGVIMNGGTPYVLEFNCRFGDPETQAVLPLLETDLSDICSAILNKRLSEIEIKWRKEFAVTVVLASGGYPGKFEKGLPISGLENVNDKNTIVFHAGTTASHCMQQSCTSLHSCTVIAGKEQNHSNENENPSFPSFLTSGGRVLAITSLAGDIESAIEKVYSQVKLISFQNMHYRTDIAKKAL